MRLCYVRTKLTTLQSRNFLQPEMRARFIKTKLRKKWNILLPAIFIILLLLTVYLLLVRPRRPKTLLIYNNEHLCSSKLLSPLADDYNSRSVVIVVLSCRRNFSQRKLIRETYGSIRILKNVHILAIVFMLGGLDAPDDTKTDIDKLEEERAQFGDLVMGDFVDTYKNLTRKSIMAYDWLVSFCHEADFVVKTDDDVMVNIFKLTDELGKWSSTMSQSLNIWCAVHWNEKLNRTETSRYYVSPEEYADDLAPAHCAGVGYVTPMIVVKKIANEISRSFLGAVCPQEDIFMTGIVPQEINSGGNEQIELNDKMMEWIMYILEHNENYSNLMQVIELPSNETIDFADFRKLFGTRLFYLIDHGKEFERVYQRMWYIVESCYRHELEFELNN